MIKYLIKSTNEVRLDTMEEVEEFHKQLQVEAEENDYTLSTFSWAEKSAKVDGEVEIFYQVKYSFVFNVLKAPERAIKSVKYDFYDGVSAEW